MIRYAWRDLVRNPRRTIAAMVGVALGVGLFSGVLFFLDGSTATMTSRALAPLALDIERIVTASPEDMHLAERISGPATLQAGERASVELTVRNDGTSPANDVVVRDEPPPPLAYVPDSTTIDGAKEPDVEGDSPLSHGVAGFGLDIGRLDPGVSITIGYTAEATEPVPELASLPAQGTVSSREQPVPIEANAARVLPVEELADAIGAIPGVAAADELGMVDLPPGALASDGREIREPARVFAFDQRYLDNYPSIQMVDGGLDPEGALLSVEAARSLGVETGGTISLRLPGGGAPLQLPVAGIVDLARAEPLFSSRKAQKLEAFLYVPNAVVIAPDVFRDEIVPAFEREHALFGGVTRSFPVSEIDVSIDRSALDPDPSTAHSQTVAVAAAMEEIGPGQGYAIDNISNTLAVAGGDAAAGRRMFLFLGLPGAVLAAFLAAYAGGVLAATERREHATLRVRGAHRGHLRTIALTKAVSIACAGSVIGVALGWVSASVVLGPSTLLAASPGAVARSALLAVGVGVAITAVALYLPARRSVRREVSVERHEMRTTTVPAWRRWYLDAALVAIAAAIEFGAIRTGALDPPAGSVYSGLAISLPIGLMPAPLLAWLGGLLLCVRALLAFSAHAPAAPQGRFGPTVRGIAGRGLRRRAGDLAGGIVGLGLVVAFGVSLSLFAATYSATKAQDARFSVGGDLRITPSVLSARRPSARDAAGFLVSGVAAVTPVVFDVENAVLIGPTNQQRKNLAAIDAESLASVAPPPDQVFVDAPAADSLAALAGDLRGVLIDEETADDLSVDVEDRVQIILALGTNREATGGFRVVGLFERFPGTPAGANLVMDLDRYRQLTGIAPVDFFLARVDDASRSGLARAAETLASGPGSRTPMHIDTTETALNKEQSSLTAVNVNGLVRLNAFYALLMSATAIAIFVFGLLLQRRREYVALRAQGVRGGEVRALILIEAAVVTVCGLVAGVLVGTLTALLSIRILRGLFILEPRMTVPAGPLVTLGVSVVLAALLSALAATELIRRLQPTEILREG